MSPRSAEQNQALRDESRARILQSALALFAKHGYEQTSVRMIAQAAGVSQGLMYNYFAGKEALLRALFEQSVGQVHESFALAGDDPEPRVRLERYIRGSFDLLRCNLSFWRLSYGVRSQPAVLAGIGSQLAGWTAAILAELEGHFRGLGARDPATEARVLFAVIDGISQHYALDPEGYPLDAVVDLLVEKYGGAGVRDGEESRQV